MRTRRSVHSKKMATSSVRSGERVLGASLESPLTIESLPSEMLCHIFSFLPQSDLNSVKLVCKEWQGLVNRIVPQSVKADDRLEGNPEYVGKIVKKTTTVRRLATKRTASQALCGPVNPNSLAKMMIKGSVYPNIFVSELMNFQNLNTLLIGGKTLLRLLNLDQSIYLPRLTKLVLNSAFDCDMNFNIQTDRYKEAVAVNTQELLKNIWCPMLREVAIDGDVEQSMLSTDLEWKTNILLDFICKYQKTLKKLVIGESSILRSNKTLFPKFRTQCQVQLQHLHFSFYGTMLEEHNVWAELLLSQKELKTANIGLLWYPHAHAVIKKLPATLESLTLYWNVCEGLSLRCSWLSKFKDLERLELTYDGIFGEHMCQVAQLKECPKLKVLVIEQILVPSKGLEKLYEYLPLLEVLYLYGCGDRKGRLRCREEPFGITACALNNFMQKLPKLRYLHVLPNDFIGSHSDIKSMKEIVTRSGTKRRDGKGYFMGMEPDWLSDSCDSVDYHF